MKREGILQRLRCHVCGAGVDNRAAPCVCPYVNDDDDEPRGVVVTRGARVHVTAASGAFDHRDDVD